MLHVVKHDKDNSTTVIMVHVPDSATEDELANVPLLERAGYYSSSLGTYMHTGAKFMFSLHAATIKHA